MPEKEDIVREVSEVVGYMTDAIGLEGSEKAWWDEMKRDVTGLRGSIEALEDQAFETSEGRSEAVKAIENILARIQLEVHAVDHVNGGTVNVVDNTTLNYAKVQVKRRLEHCIEVVQSCAYEVIRTEQFEDKFGAPHVSQVRRFKEVDAGGKYQVWNDARYVQTLPEEEGDLMYQERTLQDFSVVVRPTEEEKLRVIGERLAHQINRLNQLRKDVSKLKGYVREHRNFMPSSTDFETNLGVIYALFPVENTAFVVFDMENRLSKDIVKNLEKVQEFLTYFNVADYTELDYIEKKVKAIRDALRELLKDNKSTVTEYAEAQKKTSEESNGEDNPPTGDSAAPEEAKGGNKPTLMDRIRNWRLFGKRGNIKSLLLELEALGDDSLLLLRRR